ncbi:MAG: hypothetical protein OET63_19000 [Desulfobacterales bacterium]|nr:hypothetical protein [Desulfobacterales bacterium]
MLQAKSRVVDPRLALEFHAPQSHAYPAVEPAVCIAAVRPWLGEVIRCAPDDAVQLHNHIRIQVVAALGNLSDFGFEVLHGLGSHPHEPRLDVEAQKAEAFMEPRHRGLFGTQGESEAVRDETLNQCQCLFGFLLRAAEYHKVIGISYEAIAVFVEIPVEDVEGDVSQQGRSDPTLGCSPGRRSHFATLHHSRLEELLYQSQDVPICDHLRQLLHDGFMGEMIETTGDVGVEHPTVPLPSQFQDFLYRIMTASSDPEAIGVVMKLRLEDRVQQAPEHLLRNAISDCWNSKRTEFCPLGVLGNVDPPSR